MQEQAEGIHRESVLAFFQTELGRRILEGKEILREFKFSILDAAEGYGDGLEEEQVLLQGVVDCAIVEDSGITVLDFKTDYVTEDTLEEVSGRYRSQVEAYARALSRIYQKRVQASYLYFFRLDRFVKM